jgi:hypothetical protein
VNPDTTAAGLLLESAQTHQRLVEENLQRLKLHTQDLDGIVREEIRRTLSDELQALNTETRLAVQSLRAMRRAVGLRTALWTAAVAIGCVAAPMACLWSLTPSAAEILALRAQRDALTANLERLSQQGGRVDWRRCGEARRLCVRVERAGAAFGDAGDYFIVKGY